jgi:hypothetical protein
VEIESLGKRPKSQAKADHVASQRRLTGRREVSNCGEGTANPCASDPSKSLPIAVPLC